MRRRTPHEEEPPEILIVDDIEANLVALDALLVAGDLDCTITRASSGNEALRHLLRRDFAVMLLDVQMPEMDGFEVARLARGNPRSREVPIIFITAMLETDESAFRGYDSGAVDVLFKPVNAHVLVSKVRVFLDLHRSKAALASEIVAHERTLAELAAFNYSVSHDLRAPLRPIAGFTRILLDEHGEQLGEEGRRLLGRITTAADRMTRIIDDLLRLAQIGRTRIDARELDLSALAAAVVADVRAGESTATFDVVIEPDLVAHGDEALLRIALENLVRNAWKFTSKESAPRIALGAQRSASGVVHYFVRDNGVGFDPAHASKLFKPFQRLHARDQFEGTGIGLAIVERIIAHHGGRIWAESKPNEGATFCFTLG